MSVSRPESSSSSGKTLPFTGARLERRVKVEGSSYSSYEDYWGLAIANKPILECSRDERIAALDALPRLVDRLKEETQSRVDKIQKAKSLLK